MTLHKFLKFQNIHIYFPKFKQLHHFMTCAVMGWHYDLV